MRIACAINELGLVSVAIYPQEDRMSLHRLKVNEAYQVGQDKCLWLNLLHGDGIPRAACSDRHYLPVRDLVTANERRHDARKAFRSRSGGLVLALCGRCLAVPVRLRLRRIRSDIGHPVTRLRPAPMEAGLSGRCSECWEGRFFSRILHLSGLCLYQGSR